MTFLTKTNMNRALGQMELAHRTLKSWQIKVLSGKVATEVTDREGKLLASSALRLMKGTTKAFDPKLAEEFGPEVAGMARAFLAVKDAIACLEDVERGEGFWQSSLMQAVSETWAAAMNFANNLDFIEVADVQAELDRSVDIFASTGSRCFKKHMELNGE